MKKILLVISIFLCSCDNSNSPTKVNAEVLRITLPNGSYQDYVKFTYDRHEYMTDYRSEFLYHLPSCPCYESHPKSILDYE